MRWCFASRSGKRRYGRRRVARFAPVVRRFGVVLALLVLLVVSCSTGSSGYGRGTEATFMEACTTREQQPVAVCTCIYQQITQRVPYDRYVELDKQMQRDDRLVPDELVSIAADCSTRSTSTTTSTSTSTSSSS